MRFLLVFASDHGQTAEIARRIGETLEEEASAYVELVDVRHQPDALVLELFDGIIIGASLHNWRYQEEIADFVSFYLDGLRRAHTAFFSVSLSEADPDPARHQQLEQSLRHFLAETGWRPDCIASFAGALPEGRLNWLSRLFWRRLDHARHEYTDWNAVTEFATSFAASVRVRGQVRA